MPLPVEIRPVKLPLNERASILALASFADYGIMETHRRNRPNEPLVIRLSTYQKDPIQVGGLAAVFEGLGLPQKDKNETAGFYVHTSLKDLLLDPISKLTPEFAGSKYYRSFVWTAIKYGFNEKSNKLSPRPTSDTNLRRRQTHMLGVMSDRIGRMRLVPNDEGVMVPRKLGELVTEKNGSSHIVVRDVQGVLDWLKLEEEVMTLRLYQVMEVNPATYIEVPEEMVKKYGEFAREAQEKALQDAALLRNFERVFKGVDVTSGENPGSRSRSPSFLRRFCLPFEVYLPGKI